MVKVDSLSRRPDHKKGMENDNKDVTLLKPEFFRIQALNRGHLLIHGDEKELLKKIRESKAHDEQVVKAVEAMKKAGVRTLNGREWEIEQDLVPWRGKVYVPKKDKLRLEIVRLHHDTPIGGRGGQWKTTELVTRNYWWPGITKFIKTYVGGCDKCQRSKSSTQPPAGKLMPNSALSQPWTHISVDFIVKLPEAQGHDTILVVCDRMSKMVHIILTTEATSAQGLVALYRDYVWKLHGLPESIISDHGLQFAAQLMKELNMMLRIKSDLATAFHPQLDGQTERMNQELEQYLRSFIDHKQETWPECLALAEFAYNNKAQASTKQSLFFINNGRHPRMGFEPRREGKQPAAQEFVEQMKDVQEEAQVALKKAQDDMKIYADCKCSKAPEYKVGDKVMLSTQNLNIAKQPTRKLMERWAGPYKITKIVSSNAIELELPPSMKICPVVNVSRMKPWKQPMEGQSKPAPLLHPGLITDTPRTRTPSRTHSHLKMPCVPFKFRHISDSVLFHAHPDTPRTPCCSMHIQTHLGLHTVPCTSRHPSDSVLLPDNSLQMHLLSLPSSYSLYDTHSFTYYSIILKSPIIYLTLCPYHMIHVATYISLHGIYLI
jgi:hypothetical protein